MTPDAEPCPTCGTVPARVLSPRETEILQMLAEGLEYKQIAGRLFVAPPTVKQLLGRAYRKLGAHNGPHAVALAIGAGIIAAPGPTADMLVA